MQTSLICWQSVFLHWTEWIACSSDYNVLIICVLFDFSCFLIVPSSWSRIETCFLILIFLIIFIYKGYE